MRPIEENQFLSFKGKILAEFVEMFFNFFFVFLFALTIIESFVPGLVTESFELDQLLSIALVSGLIAQLLVHSKEGMGNSNQLRFKKMTIVTLSVVLTLLSFLKFATIDLYTLLVGIAILCLLGILLYFCFLDNADKNIL